ncbi:MAG: F0F1 ATP synthase subunit B [Succinivibrionaceae bacterium]|nr:F0F1 ATP synthase subunit B [Succinivibrionaceae bacterium]
MSFNMTFIVQIIVFLIFVAICMKYIWPPLMNAISERQNEISESINSAKQASQELELAKINASKIVSEAKGQAQAIIDSANKRKSIIIDEAAEEAKSEKVRIIKSAEAEIEAERNRTMEELRRQISVLAVSGAQKIIESKLEDQSDKTLIDKALNNL